MALKGAAKRDYQRKYMKKRRSVMTKEKKSVYNPWIYCLDIETSTTKGDNAKGEKVDVSFMISFASVKLNTETGELIRDYFGRTYKELDEYLYKLLKESNKLKTIIYIHFFGYEFSFFKDNLKFFREKTTRQLFVKPHKPLLIDCENLSFRCSNLLTAKSVKKLGEELSKRLNEDWHKLDFDYKKVRTPLSYISKKEKDYNFRDCEIVVKYIYEVLLKKYTLKELFDKIYTKTGITRIDNKKNNTAKDYRSWIIFNNMCRPPTEKQYRMEELCFMGGFVSSNPNYCGKHLQGVGSFDETSAYPAMMYLLKFPYLFKYREDLKNINNFKEFCDNRFFNIKKFFYGTIAVKDFRMKKDFNYPIWSKHKTYSARNLIDINGKVISADYAEFCLTSLDWDNLCKFYDFEIVEVRDIYVNRYCRYLPNYIRNNLERLLRSKTELKPFNSEIEDAATLKRDYQFPEDFKWLGEMINEADSLDSQKVLMGDYYQHEKSNLNAQYGVTVERPVKSVIEYDYTSHSFKTLVPDYQEFLNKKSVKTNMAVGTFVTAFARHHLIKMLYILLKNGIEVYYTDTDSIKFDYSEKALADRLIKEFNEDWIYHQYGIGKFAYELTYKDFCTNGNKSYIVGFIDKEGNYAIKATISGMSAASKIYNNLYNNYCGKDFDKLIDKCFAFNVTVNPSVTNKLTSVYADKLAPLEDDEDIEFPDPKLIHVKIGKYEDWVYTGLILKEVPMSIKGLELSIDQFRNACNLIRYFKLDYHKLIYKTTIDLNSDGDIIILEDKIDSRLIKKIKEVKAWQG